VQSTDQVWIEQTLDDHHRENKEPSGSEDDDDVMRGQVLVIRQASEHLLHRVVHLDNDRHHQLLKPASVQQQSYSRDEDNGVRPIIAVCLSSITWLVLTRRRAPHFRSSVAVGLSLCLSVASETKPLIANSHRPTPTS